jgi:hypothetical protein
MHGNPPGQELFKGLRIRKFLYTVGLIFDLLNKWLSSGRGRGGAVTATDGATVHGPYCNKGVVIRNLKTTRRPSLVLAACTSTYFSCFSSSLSGPSSSSLRPEQDIPFLILPRRLPPSLEMSQLAHHHSNFVNLECSLSGAASTKCLTHFLHFFVHFS